MKLLLVRHAMATGQEPGAILTKEGETQAQILSSYIAENFPSIQTVTCSPFIRTGLTVEPLTIALGIQPAIDDRLRECYYMDNDEETAAEGLTRILSFVRDLDLNAIHVIVSHGDLLDLFLRHYGSTFALSRPDLYLVQIDADVHVSHLWNAGPVPLSMRHSARAVLFNSQRDRIFLFHLQLPDRSIWITPGGRFEEGEAPTTALQRELYEELGLRPGEYTVDHHLWTGLKIMNEGSKLRRFVDEYFLVTLLQPTSHESFNFANQTVEERAVLKGFKWWPINEIALSQEAFAPQQLAELTGLTWLSLPSHTIIDEPI